jgi:2-dehydropantoate 2-reductase
VDAHIGAINDAASGHGLETPLVRRMIGMIHEIEEGRRPQALANLDELDRIIDPTGLRRAGVPLPE